MPTVNLRLPTEMALPPYGVYATRVLVDGQSYIAATNIGVKPTFLDGGAPTIEPHLLDFAGDLYGKMIHVELHKFLRPEMQFESVEALKTAIEENPYEESQKGSCTGTGVCLRIHHVCWCSVHGFG